MGFDDADITQLERDSIESWLSEFDRLMDEACKLLDRHPVYVKDGVRLCSWCSEPVGTHQVVCPFSRLREDILVHKKTARFSLDIAVHDRP